MCSNFNVVVPFGTTTPRLKNSKGGVQNERKTVGSPTDILVHVGSTRGLKYFMIMFELVMKIFILCTMAVWLARLPARHVTAEREALSPQSGTCKINLINLLRSRLTAVIWVCWVCAMHWPTTAVLDSDSIKIHSLLLWCNRLHPASVAYRRTSSRAGTSRYVSDCRIYRTTCFA